MHRFDGVGYIDVGGKRRFKDRELPTYIGSKPDDEIMNAFMEEIALTVEHAGLTLAASGAADEVAGWGQLRDAIFNSEAITDAGISDVSIDKFSSGDASLVGSSFTNRVNASPTPSVYTFSSSSLYKVENEATSYRTLMTNNGFDSGGDGLNVVITPGGVNFAGASHPSDDKGIDYNKYVRDRSSTTWIANNGGWDLLNTVTLLPDTVDIISASVKYVTIGGVGYNSNASLSYSSSGGFWSVDLHVQNGGTTSTYQPTGNVRIYFEIDGNTL